MARIQSLSILLEQTGNDFLSELYGKVIENVEKGLISGPMKNRDLSGNPESGTVEAKRFVNASAKAYGTARAAGKGDNIKARPVTVPIDQDREIVEELENKDITLYGVDGVLERRARNHILRMDAELDTEFFKCANTAANAVDCTGLTAIDEILEKIIQECETTQNNFVDGVPRALMNLVLSPAYYGKVRNRQRGHRRRGVLHLAWRPHPVLRPSSHRLRSAAAGRWRRGPAGHVQPLHCREDPAVRGICRQHLLPLRHCRCHARPDLQDQAIRRDWQCFSAI